MAMSRPSSVAAIVCNSSRACVTNLPSRLPRSMRARRRPVSRKRAQIVSRQTKLGAWRREAVAIPHGAGPRPNSQPKALRFRGGGHQDGKFLAAVAGDGMRGIGPEGPKDLAPGPDHAVAREMTVNVVESAW